MRWLLDYDSIVGKEPVSTSPALTQAQSALTAAQAPLNVSTTHSSRWHRKSSAVSSFFIFLNWRWRISANVTMGSSSSGAASAARQQNSWASCAIDSGVQCSALTMIREDTSWSPKGVFVAAPNVRIHLDIRRGSSPPAGRKSGRGF